MKQSEAVDSAAVPPPLVVVLLAGNSVTAERVFACLTTADTRALRRVHPVVAAEMQRLAWADLDTPVVDVVRWRAALPAAVGVTLLKFENNDAWLAALAGLTSLRMLADHVGITNDGLARLPPTLRVLDVTYCTGLKREARFDHLVALEELTCMSGNVMINGAARLPPSLRVLRMDDSYLPPAADLSHLVALRVLSGVNCSSLASLPPSLQELDLSWPGYERIPEEYVWPPASIQKEHVWPPGKPLAHLTQLRVLLAPRRSINDAALAVLPPSLAVLDVTECHALTSAASFAHLPQLRTLRAKGTMVSGTAIATLPPSLQELDVSQPTEFYLHSDVCTWPRGASLVHFTQLRVLNAARRSIDDAALLALPPLLNVLDVTGCDKLTPAASFAHLTHLHTLRITHTAISDATIAALPPSLVTLHAMECRGLTPAAVLPALPALRELDVAGSGIGNVMAASMPPSLTHLCVADCTNVTRGATFNQLTSLQVLQSSGTNVSPDVLAAYRARGCWVPAAGELRGLDASDTTFTLAVLPDGRLACCERTKGLTMWDHARGEDAIVPMAVRIRGIAKAVAVRTREHWARGEEATICVGVTDPDDDDSGAMAEVAIDNLSTTRPEYFGNKYGVSSVAILPDNRMAAGRLNGSVCVVLYDENDKTLLQPHIHEVTALVVLPDGTLASGSVDCMVAIYNVETDKCIGTMAGHRAAVRALAVLPDGTLASGSDDATVRLWNTKHQNCVGVLAAGAPVTTLAVTAGGQLAAGCADGTIRVWDACPSRDLACAPSRVFDAHRNGVTSLVPLPDGRLASAAYYDTVRLWRMPPSSPSAAALPLACTAVVP